MRQLFGTDGIRGRAGEFPLDSVTVARIGSALARRLRKESGRAPSLVTGRDTRQSGEWIEAAFCGGAASEGAACASAGVIPTPGVAYLTGAFDFDAGVVISASHNPFEDNGIKIFSPSGRKIDETAEGAIEADISAHGSASSFDKIEVSTARRAEFAGAYFLHLWNKSDSLDVHGLRMVIDCANGAASDHAPLVFFRAGADVVLINNKPNGRNINENCGSLHLENLRASVVKEQAELGVAFDGDADRALFVDNEGNIVDGDATLWILAQHLKSHGKLANSTVVATVMSNIGLEIALRSKGIELLRTSVGDKNVLDKLIETGSEVGGEQSGHIIFPEISLVGDGMMTALLVLRAIVERGVSLSKAIDGFVRFPQTLVNINVKEKPPFESVAEIAAASDEIERELQGQGRLLLRYSGTENLARVMIEGKEQISIEKQAARLARVIQDTIG